MTKGLPGSGKSTWVIEQLSSNPGQFKRINKDSLRLMLDNSKWSKQNEEFVVLMRDTMALSALEKGWSVIIDDTNLHPKHELHLRELAKHAKAEFEIKDFTDISLQDCIKNDLKRYDSVGEKVIRDMYKSFLKSKPPVVSFSEVLPTAILCDIDGTLALFPGKNPYDRDFSQDEVNDPVVDILEAYRGKQVSIVLVSGRNSKYLPETLEWLDKKGIPHDAVFMTRKPEDNRKDVIIKQEIYDKHIKGKFNVLFVLDDRNQVVELWRSLGLTCLQVAEGDF